MAALVARGHRATFLEGNLSLVETLPRLKPDICFNLCEGHWGDSRESHVPAILEMLRIPYTCSQVLTLALTLDKPMTKRVLHYHRLPTPEFQVFERLKEDFLPPDGGPDIFDTDPLIPSHWRDDWHMSVVLQDDAGGVATGGGVAGLILPPHSAQKLPCVQAELFPQQSRSSMDACAWD
jgi:hypothetical protein